MGKRKAYTPFSTSSEAGTTTAPVEGYINVDQEVKPTVDTGFLDKQGIWQGHQTSDTSFGIYQKDEAIANGGTILTPSVTPEGAWPLDMTGYNDISLAIKVTNTGAYKIEAVMGPDSVGYANLSPVVAAAGLRIGTDGEPSDEGFYAAFQDAAETLGSADAWYIFSIQGRLRNQKLLQFAITNNSGDISTIETAFMRIV